MSNYLYFSDSPDGRLNLARDEWFLDHVGEDDLILYFYINENDVIIGKNQNPWKECALGRMEEDGVRLVRRVTGGGAVYHDAGNLNYSFVAGRNRYDKDRLHGSTFTREIFYDVRGQQFKLAQTDPPVKYAEMFYDEP